MYPHNGVQHLKKHVVLKKLLHLASSLFTNYLNFEKQTQISNYLNRINQILLLR